MVARLISAVAVLLVVLGALARHAHGETLVMVSPPGQLDGAVRSALAPWRVKIIVIDLASGTPAELALTLGAGFVVWRDDDELVLWNAKGGVGERRDIPPDLDDANAAALALSIKTWMDLGAPPPPLDDPPPVDDPPPDGPPPDGPPAVITKAIPPPPPRLRVSAATGVRQNAGDHGRTEVRAAFGAGVRLGPVDAVLSFELGADHPATAVNGSGDYATTVVAAHGYWPVPLGAALRVGPGVGLVLERVSFAGVDTMDRAVAATGLGVGLDGRLTAEWRRGRLLIGAELGATFMLNSTQLQDRNVKLDTPTHIEPLALARIGLVLR